MKTVSPCYKMPVSTYRKSNYLGKSTTKNGKHETISRSFSLVFKVIFISHWVESFCFALFFLSSFVNSNFIKSTARNNRPNSYLKRQ